MRKIVAFSPRPKTASRLTPLPKGGGNLRTGVAPEGFPPAPLFLLHPALSCGLIELNGSGTLGTKCPPKAMGERESVSSGLSPG
ncbi:hypothetical protein [Scytonema sp. PRP1]|uniref:hypothetical protein n=1 Tax=Scytonema sp. PRP1 TaxID=3120513 RepID=UPI002FD68986